MSAAPFDSSHPKFQRLGGHQDGDATRGAVQVELDDFARPRDGSPRLAGVHAGGMPLDDAHVGATPSIGIERVKV
ncbi:MAG TPA: hypothetical protein VMZ66_14635 [Aeromicrobium sp.]|nr:hypothetical protein [Aeromicrobium sp.]